MSDDDRPHDAGHLSGRASWLMRVPGLTPILRAASVARQHGDIARFAEAPGPLRLEVLGFTVMVAAALALMHLVFGRPIPQYVPGIPAFVSGLMLCIGSIRIGQPFIFWEGVLSGAIYLGLGFILSEFWPLISPVMFALFCALFLASVLIRGWIALTGVTEDEATAWLFTSSLTGLFCLSWLIIMRATGTAMNPDLVLSVDLMVHGLAIIGFGTCRRKGPA